MSNGTLKIMGQDGGSSCGVRLNVDSSKPEKGFQGRAAVVTLGCAKNQVDSEVMLGVLMRHGFEIVKDVTQADVAVVNTCGFLEAAAEESIECILELSLLKKEGLRKLIVAGCLVSRYGEDLKESLPEVDNFLSVREFLDIGVIASGGKSNILDDASRPYFLYDERTPRYLSTLGHSAYIKVSEGCDRPCTFCIIPKIRGEMRSRTVDSIVSEALALGEQGVREINLVAQDLTNYGRDIKGPGLVELLKAMDASRAVDWIRLLYAYPIGTTPELLQAISDLPSVCEYLDIPLQHSSERILKEMKRPLGKFTPRNLVERIHADYPKIAIRTTFITGFPGETEDDVKDLENFIREGHFTSVGVFSYSPEEGTPAYSMADQIAPEEREERRRRLMVAQQSVNESRLESWVGRQFQVLVDGTHEETDLLLTGRARFQAPEVDGVVIINDVAEGLEMPQVGELVTVEMTEAAGYDIIGRVVESGTNDPHHPRDFGTSKQLGTQAA